MDKATLSQEMERCGVPEHCRPGLLAYFTHGRPAGQFLHSVLCNNFARAVLLADDSNRVRLYAYAVFLLNVAPAGSWGSPQKVRNWEATGGLNGNSND